MTWCSQLEVAVQCDTAILGSLCISIQEQRSCTLLLSNGIIVGLLSVQWRVPVYYVYNKGTAINSNVVSQYTIPTPTTDISPIQYPYVHHTTVPEQSIDYYHTYSTQSQLNPQGKWRCNGLQALAQKLILSSWPSYQAMTITIDLDLMMTSGGSINRC